MDFLNNALSGYYHWRELPTTGVPFKDYLVQMESPAYVPCQMVSKRLKVGIEVEVEQIRNNMRPWRSNLWTTKEDGSLRNGGIEFVSIPLNDQFIPYAIYDLFAALPKQADFSDRTSIHVHVNVRGSTCEHILNLMILYIVFEKMLYRFAGPNRYKNIFCVPVQETKLPIVLSNYLANGDFETLVRSWAKYSGLNLLPIRTQGTVEYRHMMGHRDPELLLNWINILQQLHKVACTSKFQNLFNKIKALNSTSFYEEFVINVLDERSKYFTKYNLKREMEYGVSVVKAIQPPSPFLQRLIENISNNSALLKGLNLSEAQTKKVKKRDEGLRVYEHFNAVELNNLWNPARLEIGAGLAGVLEQPDVRVVRRQRQWNVMTQDFQIITLAEGLTYVDNHNQLRFAGDGLGEQTEQRDE